MAGEAAPPAPAPPDARSLWHSAVLAAVLFAVDPPGTGGILLRSRPGPARDRWLSLLRDLMPGAGAIRRLPVNVADGRLLGGLDLAATLKAGRPMVERGLLAGADGGVLLLAMAERLEPATAAKLTTTMDRGEVVLERDGLGVRMPTRFGVVALDEGAADDEHPPAALSDRLAFLVDLDAIAVGDLSNGSPRDSGDVAAARASIAAVAADDIGIEALCAAGIALGISSSRAVMLAVRVARAAAALAGRTSVSEADIATAAQLVLAPRATRLPTAEADDQPAEEPPGAEPGANDDAEADEIDPKDLDDIVLAAAKAAIPAGLLAQLSSVETRRSNATAGRAGARQQGDRRGRPTGTRRGELRPGVRLNVVETLRAAAPWQPLRRQAAERAGARRPPARVKVRPEDFRITRYKHRSETTAIFVVDASGSAALHRLAEAKGAVELLLADCYVRRDQVALIAFRGDGAELVLPPTRSLVRAKRSLAGMPGGGGTPLATAIEAAIALAQASQRKGQTPVVILLTDGRANVARDGSHGRARAQEEARAAARHLREDGISALVIDTSPRPHAAAKLLAADMAARYVPLPLADAAMMSGAVRAAATGLEAARR